MQLYPLRLSYETSHGPLAILVDREPQGWTFANAVTGRDHLQSLPVSERLKLRGEFAAQVALANNTTKGDT